MIIRRSFHQSLPLIAWPLALALSMLPRCGGQEPTTTSQPPPIEDPDPDPPPVQDPPVQDPPIQDPPPSVDPEDPNYGVTVSGLIVDFETGRTIMGSGTISTSGLNPPPTVSVTGATFSIEHVPVSSVFQLLAGSPPDARNTYNEPIRVDASDLDQVLAKTLNESYLARLESTFGVNPRNGTGILIAKLIDPSGQPQAGVGIDVFRVNGGPPPGGVYFLDERNQPTSSADRTSVSGYAVFFDLRPGLATIHSSPGGITLTEATAPIAANTVSLATISVVAELPAPIQNVTFSTDILPIFEGRGCKNCHSGNGIGRDLGDLTLDGSANLIHREVTEEPSPNQQILRVDVAQPARSLLISLPLLESPPDRHPNVTFQNASDPDYQKILQWIAEGARKN